MIFESEVFCVKTIMYCLICFAIIQIIVTVCYIFIVIKKEKSRKSRINNTKSKEKIQNSQSEKYVTHPRPDRINFNTLEDEIKLEELDRFIKQKFPSLKNWVPMENDILSSYNGSHMITVNYKNGYYDIVVIDIENDRPKIK